ncbi:MAG: HAD-IB family hydrolase [Treponema sp.]|nr:HAD-IB family hydrolase [Treponema sp.]
MKVNIFDIDDTIVKKTTAQYFIVYALKEKVIRFSQINKLLIDWIKYKIARPDNDFIEHTVKKLKGIKKSDLDRVAEITFQKKIKQNIYADAASLIWEAQKRGERVIFATSSMEFIIKPIEKFFKTEPSLATTMEYKDGLTTGKLEGYSLFGKKKKDSVSEWMTKNNIRIEDTSFYSDSYTDIPLLEYCANPNAVNPDRILKKKAKKLGWKILRFKKTLG